MFASMVKNEQLTQKSDKWYFMFTSFFSLKIPLHAGQKNLFRRGRKAARLTPPPKTRITPEKLRFIGCFLQIRSLIAPFLARIQRFNTQLFSITTDACKPERCYTF